MSFLKIAIPRKGRLQEPTISLLNKAGYSFSYNKNILYSLCSEHQTEFVFLRASDIPLALKEEVVDLGITGADIIAETKMQNLHSLTTLNYGKCNLVLAVDREQSSDLQLLKNKRIATSFPNMTQSFFESNNIPILCLEMNGSIEVTIKLGIADAIVDISETGNSIMANNLKILKTIGHYQTQLYASHKIPPSKKHLVDDFCLRIGSVLLASEYSILEYNIPKEQLEAAKNITPGYQSPTIAALNGSTAVNEWFAVKVMVKKEKIIDTMLKLKGIGATAIFETSLRNCMF